MTNSIKYSNKSSVENSVAKLDHVNFTVTNFAKTVSWYEEIFKFKLVEQGVNPENRKWGILKSGDTMLAIKEIPEMKLESCDSHHRIGHFGLRLGSAVEWLKTLDQKRLKTFYSSPVKYPNSTSWYVRDPTGYEIEVSVWKNNELQFPKQRDRSY